MPNKDEIDAVIEELQDAGEHPCRSDLPFGEMLRQSATILRALAEENEEMRRKLAGGQ